MAARVHEMEHHAADWATTRPSVSGTQGVVAAGHPLVSMAGMRMLLVGRQCVRRGGGGRLRGRRGRADRLLHAVRRVRGPRPRRPQRRDASRQRPGHRARPGDARVLPRARPRRIPTGPGPDAHLSFTVPGAVDAYLTVLETYGHAERERGARAGRCHYAEHGFPMYEYMHRLLAIAESRSQFDLYPPGGTAVFYPGGRRARGRRAVRAARARRARCGGWSRPTPGPRPSHGRHRRRARALSIAATSPPPSAPSPSAWAGSSAPTTSPAIARGSSRRSAWRSPGARSSARRAGRRGRC